MDRVEMSPGEWVEAAQRAGFSIEDNQPSNQLILVRDFFWKKGTGQTDRSSIQEWSDLKDRAGQLLALIPGAGKIDDRTVLRQIVAAVNQVEEAFFTGVIDYVIAAERRGVRRTELNSAYDAKIQAELDNDPELIELRRERADLIQQLVEQEALLATRENEVVAAKTAEKEALRESFLNVADDGRFERDGL